MLIEFDSVFDALYMLNLWFTVKMVQLMNVGKMHF